MRKFITLLLILTASFTAQAQEWTFEIQPMHFGCEETPKYNDTADRLVVRTTGAIKEGNMELFCELYNSRTGYAVRPGRNYYVPVSLLTLLISTGKDINAINQALAPFDIIAIRETQ